jgi:hypothetical protein
MPALATAADLDWQAPAIGAEDRDARNRSGGRGLRRGLAGPDAVAWLFSAQSPR